jgi:hypothetical protein
MGRQGKLTIFLFHSLIVTKGESFFTKFYQRDLVLQRPSESVLRVLKRLPSEAAEMEPERPERGHVRPANQGSVLLYDVLRGRAQEEVQVEDPADRPEGDGRGRLKQDICKRKKERKK